jgi:protease I
MKANLNSKKFAVLVTDGFEQSEFEKPVDALKDAGADVEIVSLKKGEVKAWKDGDWGKKVEADKDVSEARADDYDGLVLPGGVMNPDKLRMNEQAVAFVKSFHTQQKPIAAICHAPWTLINAEIINGRTLTSYPSLRADLENAGAKWVNEEVVVDGKLVTSRNPKDLPAFCSKMLEEFSR